MLMILSGTLVIVSDWPLTLMVTVCAVGSTAVMVPVKFCLPPLPTPAQAANRAIRTRAATPISRRRSKICFMGSLLVMNIHFSWDKRFILFFFNDISSFYYRQSFFLG